VSVPLNATDALMLSPGSTGLVKYTGLAGYISYQP